MLRRCAVGFVAFIGLTVGAAGCGDDAKSSSTTKSSGDSGTTASTGAGTTLTTATTNAPPAVADLNEDEQAYADALAAGMATSEANGEIDSTSRQCFAEGVVAAVGIDTFERLGLTKDDLRVSSDSSKAFEGALNPRQAGAVADALFDCLDVGTLIAAQVSGGLSGVDGECFGDVISNSQEYRDSYARTFIEKGTPFQLSAAGAKVVAPQMLACFDFATLAASKAGPGTPGLDLECLGEQMGMSPGFEAAFARNLAGASDVVLTAEEAGVLAESAVVCIDIAKVLTGQGLILDAKQTKCVLDAVDALPEHPFVALLTATFDDIDAGGLGAEAGRAVLAPIVLECAPDVKVGDGASTSTTG